MTVLLYFLMVLFVIVSILMMLLILIQKGRGGGLASAFGGGGGNTAFGAKTGDVLTWATSIFFGVFMLLAIGLTLVGEVTNENYKQQLQVQVVPPPAAQPAGPTTNP